MPIRAAVLAAALLALPAAAQTPSSPFLERLTSPELRDAIHAGRTTILVPIGGTEQNGPHMVLGKHNVRASLLAERIAVKLGNALVAPVVAYVPEGRIDPPTGHMRFAGTITVPGDVFEKLLESAARSFRAHGFRDIVFLGDHGDYRANLEAVAARLNREWRATPVRVHAIAAYYRAATEDYARWLKEHGHSQAEIGTHAGLADTALALAVDPALVRADKLAQDPKVSEGVHGDPRRATAEIGKAGVDLVVERTTEAIRAATRR